MSRKRRSTKRRLQKPGGRHRRQNPAAGATPGSIARAGGGSVDPMQALGLKNAGGSPGPMSPAQRLAQADQLKNAGRMQEAIQAFEACLREMPDNAGAWAALGECRSRIGQYDQAIRDVERASGLSSRDPRILLLLGHLLFHATRCDEAMERARQALALDASLEAAHCIVARCYEWQHQVDDAITYLEAALEDGHLSGYGRVTLGHLFARRKDTEKARTHFEQALADPTLPLDSRLLCLNELGKLCDDRQDFDTAYYYFDQCARETARAPMARPFSLEAQPAIIGMNRGGITSDLMQQFSSPDTDPEARLAPAFLVGFPRSGTTMMEQVLAAHPDISTSGEKNTLVDTRVQCVRALGSAPNLGTLLKRLNSSTIRKYRRFYWEELAPAADIDLSRPLFLDKSPLNLIELAFVNAIFPESKVIVALRDPRDTCLSCFFQHFRLNVAMIHFLDLERTARFYAMVMDLYLQFREVLTLDLIEVRYEDVVEDFDTQARRMIDHLGVPWTDEVLGFHQKARQRYISTPSYAAVAEPVHKRAVARWKNYRQHLEPVLPILAPYVEAFGYEEA